MPKNRTDEFLKRIRAAEGKTLRAAKAADEEERRRDEKEKRDTERYISEWAPLDSKMPEIIDSINAKLGDLELALSLLKPKGIGTKIALKRQSREIGEFEIDVSSTISARGRDTQSGSIPLVFEIEERPRLTVESIEELILDFMSRIVERKY